MDQKLKMRTLTVAKRQTLQPTLEQIVCLLLFRLGGRQKFTQEEIKDIFSTMKNGGVTLSVTEHNEILLCSRTEFLF